jgi:hypothetical protein
MQSWRLYILRLREFGTWCWVLELLEGWINVVAANRVRWGSCSTLVPIVSHFPKLKTQLEVLGSECSADLTEDKADALWIWLHAASVAHNPPDSAGE